MTRAIRVDTLRNRVAATRQLLAIVEAELEDLHVLAYERQTVASDIIVNGGTRDWALDTHGNPDARAAYRDLADKTVGACTALAETAHNAIRLLRDKAPGETPRTRRLITADERVAVLAAQARRDDDRHEYTPRRSQTQPEINGVKHTIDRIIRERDQARDQAAKLERRLLRYEPVVPRRRRRRRTA